MAGGCVLDGAAIVTDEQGQTDPAATLGGEDPASILLVDDHAESLATLQAVLEPLGERLVCAESGEQALRALLHDEFSLILLDVRMADMDGLETARIIRNRPGTRHIPIIFLTAQASDLEAVALAYETGAVDYVVKPFEPEILRAKVSVFVELHRERGERVRESHARAEAEAVARTIRTLQVLSDTAMSHLELDGLANELVERSGTLLRADAVAMLLRDENAPGFRVHTSRGVALPLLDGGRVMPGEGLLGQLIGERRAALLGPEELGNPQQRDIADSQAPG
ncbi:MAG TPA: response regulator, partial [Solirubrobacteraceae bacterium]|nr:response regulator [Solirubrobacteraceae bacterium]